MYFNKKNNFFHGIMFHHFHDDKVHTKTKDQFQETTYKMIKFIGKKNIINTLISSLINYEIIIKKMKYV